MRSALKFISMGDMGVVQDLNLMNKNIKTMKQGNINIITIGHPSNDTPWKDYRGTLISVSENRLTLNVKMDKRSSGSPILEEKDKTVVGIVSQQSREENTGYGIPINEVISQVETWGIELNE